MLFQLSNVSVEKTTHCGVLEFTAEEGLVFLPYWVYTLYVHLSLSFGCYCFHYFVNLIFSVYR